MKKLKMLIIFGIIFLILTGCSNRDADVQVPKGNCKAMIINTHFNRNKHRDALLKHFIDTKMLAKQGIYTNYHQYRTKKKVATGHEMLLESSGLWLNYLVQTHQYSQFRKFYQTTKRYFDQGDQFSYRYNPKTNKKASVNSTIDDLRIIRSLQTYAQLTHSQRYRKEAAQRFQFLTKHVIKKGHLVNFYDVKSDQASSDSSLYCYDFLVLKHFEYASKTDQKYYQQQLKLVKDGYLGDAFPLYASSYNWSNGTYSSANLNTSEELETLVHLSEINQIKLTTIRWLKIKIDHRSLYNAYSTNGATVNKDQSAANYALAAIIFANQNNQKYYQKSMNEVWKSQILNSKSDIFGGLGDATTNDAYSFNNLVALIASLY
ncbi:hypothetical protein ABTQ33_10070 [Paucilactobacillus suebicus]|uniref:Glycosyl hydrolase family 8 n=1 Tax=Paucilactobacillus suebicus DSM 5007 = KCTC 3549 TaxID=1423807 RepID=A0A0R1W2A2_9LACO|nr:hypothetical protein [Paucilactobacillus suebicus]KRM11698.1 hypothetical protein FD16_GL000616 [Paucilactobacillus suebicus DSM 5007 = KCTC 3549]